MKTRRKRQARTREPLGTRDLLALCRTALDGVVQGACIYDAEHRMILGNRRYLELFGLSPEIVRPGSSYRRVLEHSAAVGNFAPELIERKWQERRARLVLGEPFSMRQQLPSGLIMTLDFRPLPDGAW